MENPRFPFIKRVSFTKVPIDIVLEEDLERILETATTSHRSLQIVLLRYRDYRRARRDKFFRSQLEKACLVLPLDLSLERGMSFLKLPLPLRLPPFDLLIKLLGLLEGKSKSLFIVGGNYKEIQAAAGNLRASFPKINLVGRHTGYFKETEESHLITAIQKATPSVLFLGTGIPKNQKWAFEQESKLSSDVIFFSPQAFEVVIGKQRRPNREDFLKGRGHFLKALINPFQWWKVISYCYYGLTLITYKIFKK